MPIKSKYKRNSKGAIKARKDPQYRHGRHCIHSLHAHLVFVTKYRRFAFSQRVLDHLAQVFAQVIQDFEGELKEFNGERDHVHLLILYPPKYSLSKIVNSLKGVSSRYIRAAKYQEVRQKLWGNKLWSAGYFVSSCGGGSLEVIKRYIQEQDSP